MTSTNIKYAVLTNYINAPTERNFNKVATVFINDINAIVHSKVYEAEYNIFGGEIASKTLQVLWKKLKDFKVDSDPQIAVSSFSKYMKNIVENISRREKSEHFKRMVRYVYLDEVRGIRKIPIQPRRMTFPAKTTGSGASNLEIFSNR